MDFCHCPIPNLREHESGETYCDNCRMWYRAEIWKRDYRVKQAKRSLARKLREDHALVDLICGRGKAQFANADLPKPSASLVFFTNELVIGADGWAMITKFGDYPSDALFPDGKGGVKKERAIQRVDKQGAEQMVSTFANARRGIRKFLKGCNIYDGHPDVPGIGRFYPDKEPKGVFAELAVRDDGLYGLPIFTNEGSDLVETKKRRAFSGNIGNSEPCGKDASGVPIYRPTELFSAGLTNSPHLPVHFFNSDGSLAGAPTQNQNTMKRKLLALFAALSLKPTFANADEPADTELEAAIDQVQTKVAGFANEQTGIKKKLLELCGKLGITFANESQITDVSATLGQAQDKIVTLDTERTAARTQFANERTARIEDEIGYAVKSGRVTEAERQQWKNRLNVETQFANELTALRGLEVKVKTEPATLKIQRDGKEQSIDVSDAKARRQFMNDAMGEVAKEKGWNVQKDYDKCFNEVQRRHPALFANMQQPEVGGRKRK